VWGFTGAASAHTRVAARARSLRERNRPCISLSGQLSTSTATGRLGATLAARALTKRFGARSALDAISFELQPGELVAIIGPNGAGKTTLLAILAGVLPPSEGEVSASAGEIGWVPQQPALYSKLSVAENLMLFARLEKLSDPAGAVAAMLAQAGLQDRADEQVGRLSGGNQQRVNIAIGLLTEPVALLLDEPSASLDPRQRERLWEFIGGLAGRGTTVVFSTHDVAEAERFADRLLVLVDGELLFTGTPAQFARAAGAEGRDLETAFVRFLRERGH
jgi:ABC-2 type transport system ATP-binding protein